MPVIERNIRKEIENRTFKEAFKYFKRTMSYLFDVDKKRFILLYFFETLSVFLPVANLFILQRIINDAVNGVFSWIYLAGFGITAIIYRIVSQLAEKQSDLFFQISSANASRDLIAKVSSLRIKDFDSKTNYNALQRAKQATYRLNWLFSNQKRLIFDILRVVSYVTVIIFWKPWLILFLLIVPLITLFRTGKVLKENFIVRWENPELWRKENYYDMLFTVFDYYKEIKILNVNEQFLKKYHDSLDKLTKRNLDLDIKYYNSINEMAFIDEVLQFGYFIFLIFEVINGKILIGNFNTYRTAFSSSNGRLNSILHSFLNIGTQLLDMKEYFDFMEYNNDYEDGKISLDSVDTIEFKNVKYKYENSKDMALRGISFKINKGERIAFIGENGSGKTTVLSLLMKVYEPLSGEILINGKNIKEYSTYSLRNKITMLMQEYTRFEETVMQNIVLSDDEKSYRNVYNKIPFKEMRDFIKKLPKGLNTILGKRFGTGVDFSKGQTQKMVLSRIFYKDSDCYILDEPNSALDPKSEKKLFDYMKNKMNDKISISTLHVFSNIGIMDKIIMFDKGKIICKGTHDELYEKNKKYKEYYNLQERSLEEKTV